MNYPTAHNTDRPVEPSQYYFTVTDDTIGYGMLTELGFNENGSMAIAWDGDGLVVLDHIVHFHDTFATALAHWNELQEARHDNRP